MSVPIVQGMPVQTPNHGPGVVAMTPRTDQDYVSVRVKEGYVIVPRTDLTDEDELLA